MTEDEWLEVILDPPGQDWSIGPTMDHYQCATSEGEPSSRKPTETAVTDEKTASDPSDPRLLLEGPRGPPAGWERQVHNLGVDRPHPVVQGLVLQEPHQMAERAELFSVPDDEPGQPLAPQAADGLEQRCVEGP